MSQLSDRRAETAARIERLQERLVQAETIARPGRASTRQDLSDDVRPVYIVTWIFLLWVRAMEKRDRMASREVC